MVSTLRGMRSADPLVTDRDLLEAMVLVQRYSLELNKVAANALGQSPTGALDTEVLLAIARGAEAGPSGLVQQLGIPRSTLARALSRLLRRGLVERSVDSGDGRRALLAPTPAGVASLRRFDTALADFLCASVPVVEEVLRLLGRDGAPSTNALPVRDVADRISAAGAAYVPDVVAASLRHGLAETPDRYAVAYLALHESRPSRIAEHLDLTPAGTTSLLDRLEGLGLVERRTGVWEADRRAVLVRLTPSGHRAARDVLTVFRRHHDTLADALDATRCVVHPAQAESQRSA